MTATEDRWTVDDLYWLCRPDGTRRTRIAAADADLFRTALDNEYARRALPDGVELHRDGTMWALGRNIPDGWGRRPVMGDRWLVAGAATALGVWYEVRPPQGPPTVRVPWWEAVGRQVSDRVTIAAVGMDAVGPWWQSESGVKTHTIKMVTDGTVEVLR